MPTTRRLFLLFIILLLSSSSLRALDEEQNIADFLWQKTIRLSPPHRPKVALVLGGGGARALAHIGVLKVLIEEKIPVDMVVGTSVGALVGALYSAGVPIEKIETIGETIKWDKITNLKTTSIISLLISEHLLSTQALEDFMNAAIEHKRFDQLNIPFVCVAADIMTGERIILREGDVGLAARASATIPGIFDPVEYRHRFLIDGGLVDNLPTDIAKLSDADVTIAVSVTSDFSKNRISNVFMMLIQSLYIQGKLLENEKLQLADIVIRPNVQDITVVDLNRSRECIDAGVLAARRMVPQIKKYLIDRISDEDTFK
ncbi:MAG: patatin-like phospholipase family protein [Elusimicrobia bacterium]|nr:patatin-like phospholipase family protein [Elusimicrobiota bacterium]